MPTTSRPLVPLIVRLALAGLFLSAGAAKLGDPNSLAEAIVNYRLMPDAWAVALAGILPVAEVLVALALIAGPCVQGAGLLAALMFAAFAAAMAQSKLRGINLECGCFGAAVPEQVSWAKVALNVTLGAFSTWIAWARPARWRDLVSRPGHAIAACAVVAILCAAFSARASVVLALDLAALVAKSDEIVLGTAGPQRARWSNDGKLIVTDMQLRVEESLKGPAHVGDVLVVTRMGGTLRDIALQVPGEANFGPDQRVLVFLHAEGSAKERHVVGMAQGVIPITGRGANAMAMPNAGGTALVERTDDGALAPGHAALAQPRPFVALRTEILRLARNGARH